MKIKFLPAIGAIVFGGMISAVIVLGTDSLESALAQSKPDAPAAAKTDVSKPAVNPLALTEAEKAEASRCRPT